MPRIPEEDVNNILQNPIYTGVGKYPRIIGDRVFIEAGVRLIKQKGAEWYLRQMLAALKASFADDEPTQGAR